MHKKNLAMAVAASLGSLAAAGSAIAQETTVFEPVIVTAQKREQSIYEVPVAISAFTAETIEKQGITTLTDIGKFVPNLNVTEFSAGHTSSANPFIRGIGLQDHLITTDPGVGVYVDGVYLGRQVGQNWSLANIERVEVLRGPQGTLYGRNSIGGAINIITVQAGRRGRRPGLAHGWVARTLERAISTRTWRSRTSSRISVTGAFQHRDGLGRFLQLENPRKEVGEMEDISARVALKWSPTDRLSFLLTADGNEGDGGLRPYDTLIDEVPNGGVSAAGLPQFRHGVEPVQQQHRPGVPGRGHQRGERRRADRGLRDLRQHGRQAAAERPPLGVQVRPRRRRFLRRLPELSREAARPTSSPRSCSSRASFGALTMLPASTGSRRKGENIQDPTFFLGGAGRLPAAQKVDSQAIYGNVGYHVYGCAAGLRGPAVYAGRQDGRHEHQLGPDRRDE